MRHPDQRGETLVEVVMALGILSLVLVSSYALATGAFRLGRGAGERTQVVNYLQQQAEALRTYRDTTGWDAFRLKVAGYGGDSAGGSFCMVNDATAKAWTPTTGKDCVLDGRTTIAITSKNTDPDASKFPPQQYQFDVVATWSDSTGKNNANIQITLADQGVK